LAEELTTAQTNEYIHVIMQLTNALFTEISADQRKILRDEFSGKQNKSPVFYFKFCTFSPWFD